MGDIYAENISAPPRFNLMFQGGDHSSEEKLCTQFSDERLTSLILTIRQASYSSVFSTINQMLTGNSRNMPGGNRYADLHLGDENHPRWVDEQFLNYHYTRREGENGVLIGRPLTADISMMKKIERLYHRSIMIKTMCLLFMIDIPLGGPSFTIA